MSQSNYDVRIALVEDDPLLRKEIFYHLKETGFQVFGVANGKSLDELLITEPIDIFILDLTLPGEDGLSIARRIRHSIPKVGIVMMTARGSTADRVKGYESGADIYLYKPVSPEELTAGLHSLMRRLNMGVLNKRWKLRLKDRSITGPAEWQRAILTNSEKVLMVGLIQAPNHTLENEVIVEILSQRSGSEDMGKRALESLVSRLRRKLGEISEPGSDVALKSVWGVGYQLCIAVDIEP
ncbi:response regulator transcription factor [Zwartia panacis]|jgi:DNA-binding response OmpR family regulator|uniref:response regulator transcription factor n=1 Tax=Zwartia panacis TaxID=2683345 RepID=UPI0025B4159C|nr:response regulator transcription factor [Zwartia panacis]MDN4016363.1 response regulator transcription factor [Zwartia panacis]